MAEKGHARVEKITVSSYGSVSVPLQHVGRSKTFLKQLYVGAGKRGQRKETSHNCELGYGTYGQRAYFYAENKGTEKTWVLTLQFNKMLNTKISKQRRLSVNSMKFVVPPGEVEVGWLKGIDFSKSFTFDWKVKEEWF